MNSLQDRREVPAQVFSRTVQRAITPIRRPHAHRDGDGAAVKTASSKSKHFERTPAPEIELLWETASLAPMPQE